MKGNFFMLDNGVFNLKLDAYEFQIYAYLVCRAGKSGECWPSINTIARQLELSPGTVIRKLDSLIGKRLIDKIGTTSRGRNGRVRTSNNHYFLRDFSDAWEFQFGRGAG